MPRRGGGYLQSLACVLGIGVVLLAACGWAGPAAHELRIVGKRVDVNLEDPGGSGRYLFDPSELTFHRGDEVTLVLTSESEFHTFTVVDLDIDVHVNAWRTEALTLTFDKPGTYRLVCTPHALLGMTGVIAVR